MSSAGLPQSVWHLVLVSPGKRTEDAQDDLRSAKNVRERLATSPQALLDHGLFVPLRLQGCRFSVQMLAMSVHLQLQNAINFGGWDDAASRRCDTEKMAECQQPVIGDIFSRKGCDTCRQL